MSTKHKIEIGNGEAGLNSAIEPKTDYKLSSTSTTFDNSSLTWDMTGRKKKIYDKYRFNADAFTFDSTRLNF